MCLGIDGDIDIDVKAENPTQSLRKTVLAAKDKKIAKEIQPLVDELNALKKNEDAKMEDDYADKIIALKDKIEGKRVELSTSLDSKLSVLDEINNFAKKAEELTKSAAPKETEAAKVKRITEVIKALGQEKPDHIIFQSTDSRGLRQFYSFVFDRADQFNGLKSTYDANKALKAYDAHIDSLRAAQRRKSIESQNAANPTKPMPNYGERAKSENPNANNKHEVLSKNLRSLADETDAILNK